MVQQCCPVWTQPHLCRFRVRPWRADPKAWLSSPQSRAWIIDSQKAFWRTNFQFNLLHWYQVPPICYKVQILKIQNSKATIPKHLENSLKKDISLCLVESFILKISSCPLVILFYEVCKSRRGRLVFPQYAFSLSHILLLQLFLQK